ncbi:uncharacterized protein B0P05DRAFT_571846 [Gilbertella persicaria]|uniref:uncharacterized protein n=1 Tax=Gilbertella persicaria TaxID=101096 RepID=UPI00221E518F|nr:uncharacterized protein B0P05DRAFT_571846 [Gilbertella persicaria]KAI8078179.1 hypothetical protein B0P05DRAFT_571846 [Gilbertella persicaria]
MLPCADVPPEVFDIIVRYLDIKDILQCRFTCQKWAKVTGKILFTEVELRNDRKIAHYANMLANSTFAPGKYLKKMSIIYSKSKSFEYWSDKDLFNKIAKHCPLIEELYVSNTCVPFWFWLMQEIYEGGLQNLKKLPLPSSNEEMEYYYRTAISMRHTLKEITLSGLYTSLQFPEAIFKKCNFINRIDEFKKLEKVRVVEYGENYSHGLGKDILLFLRRMKTLSIAIYHIYQDNNLIENDTRSLLASCTSNNVQCLDIQMLIQSGRDLVFITKQFPNLKQLNINRNCDAEMRKLLLGWNQHEIVLPVEFKDYLARLEQFNLKHINIKGLEDFIRLLVHTKTVGELRINMCVWLKGVEIHYSTIDIEYDKSSYKKKHFKLTVNKFFNVQRLLQILSDYDDLLDEVTIDNQSHDASSMIETVDNVGDMIFRSNLDYVLEACAKLRILRVANTKITSFGSGALNDSITDLIFSTCHYDPDILLQLSAMVPNLKNLTINSCIPHPDPSGEYNAEIYMPNTSFDTVDIRSKNSPKIYVLQIFLEIVTETGRKLHTVKPSQDLGEEIPLWNLTRTIHITINCKKVKRIFFEVRNFRGHFDP